jgi:hypothetical protein
LYRPNWCGNRIASAGVLFGNYSGSGPMVLQVTRFENVTRFKTIPNGARSLPEKHN